MFIMQAQIEVTHTEEAGGTTTIKNIKPSAVSWVQSVRNYTDTCKVTLPLMPYLKSTRDNETQLSSRAKIEDSTIFSRGDSIRIELGYNNRLRSVFRGFISRVSFGQPLTIECEGYSYLLKSVSFTKSYAKTTIKEILQDLTQGTEIQLSPAIPEIELSNVTFKNAIGTDVLEFLRRECLCVAYFLCNELFVGSSPYAISRPEATLRIGWNTVSDSELKKEEKQGKVEVNLIEKSPKGEIKRTKAESSKYSGVRDVRVRAGLSDSFLKEVTQELQRREDYKGYSGSLTIFLEPFFEKGYVCNVEDRRFPERSGKYFVEAVEGRFDSAGGRQKLDLIYYTEGK